MDTNLLQGSNSVGGLTGDLVDLSYWVAASTRIPDGKAEVFIEIDMMLQGR
jgi:hypothetical protein